MDASPHGFALYCIYPRALGSNPNEGVQPVHRSYKLSFVHYAAMRRHRAMRALRILLRSVGFPSFTKARPFRVLLYAASLLLLSVNLGRLAFIPGNGSSYPCHLRRASFEENLLPIDQMPGFNKQVSSKADHLIVVPGHVSYFARIALRERNHTHDHRFRPLRFGRVLRTWT